jgi:CO/xanthine dehydrogenase Mo-binding subunit
MGEVVTKCAQSAGWRRGKKSWQRPAFEHEPASPIRRGTGFACSFKNVGFSFGAPEQCAATIELHGSAEIKKAILYHAGAEVGQGAHTVMAQMTAEALDISFDKVQLITSDTADTRNSGSTSASRMTFMAGNAIRAAAEEALIKWREEERPAFGSHLYKPPATTPMDAETGKSEPNFSYGYVAEAVTVELDLDTGQIQILEVVCADDVGQAINPQQVQGQIEGAIVQAAGYTVLEDFQQAGGQVQTYELSTYLIPGILDIPLRVKSVVLENPDPIGPWGARGMAEMPYIPLAPALIAALHDATEVWFDEFPLTPERILRGIGRIPSDD